MYFQSWAEVLRLSFQNLWIGFVNFLPSLLGAIVTFILAWVIGSIVGSLVAQVFSALKIEKLLASAGVDKTFAKAGIKLDVGAFIGGLVKWFIIVLGLVAALDFIGLPQVTGFLSGVVLSYIPHVIIAALVLVIATVLADAMSKVVMASSRSTNVHSARLLGTITRYAIWIFAFIVALSELGIDAQDMHTLFAGLIAMLALAGGLAFGLGGKEAAARTIEKLRNETARE